MDLTVILVGPTGHGKSATGNTILGRKAFMSDFRTSSVTETCELQTRVLADGQTINVIDTPGFVNKSPDMPVEEYEKCLTLARNKIHAILFVVSVHRRMFLKEDQLVAVRHLQEIFGDDVISHMIVVLTDGHNEIIPIAFPFEQHEFISLCEGRYIRFNNRTEDEVKKSEQVQDLFLGIKSVLSNNGGRPFICQMFELQLQIDAAAILEQQVEARATAMEAEKEQTEQRIDALEAMFLAATTSLERQLEVATLKADERSQKYFEEAASELIQQMDQRLEAVELRVKDVTTRLGQQLAENDRSRRLQKNSDERIEKLKEMFERAENDRSRRFQTILDVTTSRLERQLAEVDERTQETQKNSDKQIQKLKEWLERAEKDRSEAILDVQLAEAETSRLVADERMQDTQKKQLAEAETSRLVADERTQDTQKNSNEQMQKLREVFERTQKNSDKQMQNLKDGLDRAEKDQTKAILDVTTRLEQQLVAMLKVDERLQEEQKNSNEQIQKLKDGLERAREAQKSSDEEIVKLKEQVRKSETKEEFGSSSFHVYDPSTYLPQSGIK